jgi:hypothetical protein
MVSNKLKAKTAEKLERAVESFPNALTPKAISATLGFSSPQGGIGNLRMSSFNDWRVGFLINPNLVEMKWAEFAGWKTGSVIPKHETALDKFPLEFGGALEANPNWGEKAKRGRGVMGSFTTNMARWEQPNRLDQSKLSTKDIAQGRYADKGTFERFAVNTWRGAYDSTRFRVRVTDPNKKKEKTYQGPQGFEVIGRIIGHPTTGKKNPTYRYNEALVQQKSGSNPVAGLFIDVSSGKNAAGDGVDNKVIEEAQRIVKEHNFIGGRPLNLYIYDKRILDGSTVRVVPASKDQGAILAALARYEKHGFSEDATKKMADFTGFDPDASLTPSQKLHNAAYPLAKKFVQESLDKSLKATKDHDLVKFGKEFLKFSFGADVSKGLHAALIKSFDEAKGEFVKSQGANADQAKLVFNAVVRGLAITTMLGRDVHDWDQFVVDYTKAAQEANIHALTYNYDAKTSGSNYHTKAKPFMLKYLSSK